MEIQYNLGAGTKILVWHLWLFDQMAHQNCTDESYNHPVMLMKIKFLLHFRQHTDFCHVDFIH